MFKKIVAIFLTMILLIPFATVNAKAAPSASKNYIVSFKTATGKEKIVKDVTKGKKIKNNYKMQNSIAIELDAQDIQELTENLDVLIIEPDAEIEILSTGKPDKNDQAVKKMQKGTQEIPWGIVDVVGTANLNKYDGKKVRVAIFDTGVSPHEDLTISGGISFAGYTQNFRDDNGHGTHVAGTIAANNNKLGIIGMAPEAEIYAVKVLNQNGSGNYSSIIAALEWAINNDIDIINMSFGGYEYSVALREAIQSAVDAGIIIVAAAGNKGEGANTLAYPANYPEVIAVGAVTDEHKVANFSSRGPNLNLVAPGVSVLSTLNDGTYAAMSGTSMAAPYVTGALAALKSKNQKLSSSALVNRIYDTATPLGDPSTYGYGFLNFAYAAGEVNGPIILAPIVSTPEETVNEGNDEDGMTGDSDTSYEGNDRAEDGEDAVVILPDQEYEYSESSEYKSDRRLKYEQLLNGDYFAIDLKEKFKELFGDYSPEYILNNYTEIFDVTPAEIDAGILELLAYAELDGDEIVLIQLEDAVSKEAIINDDSVITTVANDYPVISNISKTNTSITFSVKYTNSGDPNNILMMQDGYDWVYLLGRDGKPPGTNQTITLNNLIPGVPYEFVAGAYENGWLETEFTIETTFPPENIQTYTKTNMIFRFDKWFADLFSSGRLDAFQNKVDSAYNVEWDLVGGVKPYNGDKMEYETSKTLPIGVEGQSGQPIKWSIYTTSNAGIPTAYQVLKMNQLNVNMTETPIHEIGHNFDKSKWTFEAEALTTFKMYYYMQTTGDQMAVSNYGSVINGGAGFKTYIKSHANRLYGHINYDAAMAQGVYSPYSLAYTLSNIADATGWPAVKNTFRYFDTLYSSQIPSTQIGKFNLFLSKLQDFSGVNVFTMFTPQEKAIYQNKLGGTIQYVTVAPVPSGAVNGIVYTNGVLKPALSSGDLNANFEISALGVDSTNRWLNYQIMIFKPNGAWSTITGYKSVYKDASMVPRDSNILSMTLSSTVSWECLHMSLENNADANFLLPANKTALTGKSVLRMAWREIATNNIHYFESEIADSMFNEMYSLAYTPSSSNKDALNDNIYWYLNHTTQDGAATANAITSTEVQKGLVYNAVRIKQALGKPAFEQAFQYFDLLSPANMPNTKLGRLNLFLTKLKEFSNKDVLSYLATSGKTAYEAIYGGTIQYVAVAPPTSEIYGIMYSNGVFKPAVNSSDLEARFQLLNLEVDPANRYLKYEIKIYKTQSSWSTINGSKSVYKNASMVPRDSTILSMTMGSTSAWECVHMSLEKNADANYLLPANKTALTGKSVLRMAWREIATNNIHYFESEITNTMFDDMMALAYTPSSGNKDALNDNIYWFLNYTTQDGAATANSITSTSAQKGLVYNAMQIKQAIGKSAFEQTFQYFSQLPTLDMPQTKLGRLNLFLTKLRDYSNTDVIGLFNTSGKSVYESIYGGTIAYYIQPSIKLIGANDNYITLKAEFPVSGVSGNQLRLFDSATNTWYNFNGTGNSTANGIYTITSLSPLTSYNCSLSWNGGSINTTIVTHSKFQNIITHKMTEQEYQQYLLDNVQFHYGELDYLNGLEVDELWAANTHEIIVEQAGIMLKNDKGTNMFNILNETLVNGKTAMQVIAEGAVSPDYDTNEKDHFTWVGHFYGPFETNYNGGNDTAASRFENHYKLAVEMYESGDKYGAYFRLGNAIHYMCDLNNPHHASNKTAFNSHHLFYEIWVNGNINSYLLTTAVLDQNNPDSSYLYVEENKPIDMADNWSKLARLQYNNAEGSDIFPYDDSNAGIATEDTLKRSQRATAALLNRFIINTGRLPAN